MTDNATKRMIQKERGDGEGEESTEEKWEESERSERGRERGGR